MKFQFFNFDEHRDPRAPPDTAKAAEDAQRRKSFREQTMNVRITGGLKSCQERETNRLLSEWFGKLPWKVLEFS